MLPDRSSIINILALTSDLPVPGGALLAKRLLLKSKKLIKVIFLNLILAFPAFYYVFILEIFFIEFGGLSTNYFNKVTIISSIIFFHAIPFMIFQKIEKKDYKLFFISIITTLICIYFFNYYLSQAGGGIFFLLSFYLFNNIFLFYFFLSFLSNVTYFYMLSDVGNYP
mgnify:CR=1 FL=1